MSQVRLNSAQDVFNVIDLTRRLNSPLLTMPILLNASDGTRTRAYGAFLGGSTSGSDDQATGLLEVIATAAGNLGPYVQRTEAIIRQEAELGQTVVVFGYSLGGAVAERVCIELQKDKNGDGQPDYRVQLVTFGAPLWTDGQIADSQRTDFVAQGDPVPYLGTYTARPQNRISPEDGQVLRVPFGPNGAHESYKDDIFAQYGPFGNATEVLSIDYNTGDILSWKIRGIGSYIQGTAPVTDEGVAQSTRARAITEQMSTSATPERQAELVSQARALLDSAMGVDTLRSQQSGVPEPPPARGVEPREGTGELVVQSGPGVGPGVA